MYIVGIVSLDLDNNVLIDNKPLTGTDELEESVKILRDLFPDSLYEDSNSFLFKKKLKKISDVDILCVLRDRYEQYGRNGLKFNMRNFQFLFETYLCEVFFNKQKQFDKEQIEMISQKILNASHQCVFNWGMVNNECPKLFRKFYISSNILC